MSTQMSERTGVLREILDAGPNVLIYHTLSGIFEIVCSCGAREVTGSAVRMTQIRDAHRAHAPELAS